LLEIPAPVRADLQAVEAGCAACLHSQGTVPEDFVRLIDGSPSRMLRPALLLIVSRLSGYRGDNAIHYATAVELIHRATLLHRTIRNATDLSNPAAAWHHEAAVLLGDYLYVSAMQRALAPDRRDIVQLICEATRRTFEGELYHLGTAHQATVNESDYLEMMTRRTAPLFAACAEIGARLGRVDALAQRALAQYGFGFGMASQLLDDGALEQASTRALEYAEGARRAIATLTSYAEHTLLMSLLDTVVAQDSGGGAQAVGAHVED
jgi:octaprenyl-diphosphate synthase